MALVEVEEQIETQKNDKQVYSESKYWQLGVNKNCPFFVMATIVARFIIILATDGINGRHTDYCGKYIIIATDIAPVAGRVSQQL